MITLSDLLFIALLACLCALVAERWSVWMDDLFTVVARAYCWVRRRHVYEEDGFPVGHCSVCLKDRPSDEVEA